MVSDASVCPNCGRDLPADERHVDADGYCSRCRTTDGVETARSDESSADAANDDGADASDSPEDTTDDGADDIFWDRDPETDLRSVEPETSLGESAGDDAPGDDSLDRKIDSWKEQLLDLSRRNSLVDFTATKTKSLPLLGRSPTEAAGALLEDPLQIRKHREGLADPAAVSLADDQALSGRTPDETDSSLGRIGLYEKQFLRERGVDTLYLSLGTLEWTVPDEPDDPLTSPLFLAAVDLERETLADADLHNYLVRPEGEDLLVNPALRKKLASERGLTLPPDQALGLECLDAAFEQIHRDVKGFDDWAILGDVVLGIFDFAKFGLYADLEANREAVRANPVVRALHDDPSALREAEGDSESPEAAALDDAVHPSDVFQVLDADSSQQAAIEAAKAGRSLVVQGPPGTGKSQTIANLIAEKLALDETVLFVSEKQAALDAVKNRLDAVGLGRFCLEAHGRKASKANILESLGRELHSNPVKAPTDRAEKLLQLTNTRSTLNDYGEALLSAPEGFDVTPYEAYGTVAARRDAPVVPIDVDRALDLDQATLDDARDALAELAYYDDELERYDTHPWRHATVDDWRVDTAARVEDVLDAQLEAVAGLRTTADRIASTTGLDVDSVDAFREALGLLEHVRDRPDVTWTERHFSEALGSLDDLLAACARHERRVDELRSQLGDRYRESYFGEDGGELHADLSRYGAFRSLRPSYRSLRRRVREHTREAYTPGDVDLREDARALLELQQLEADREEYRDVRDALGDLYRGRDTDWDSLLAAVRWIEELERYDVDTDPIESRLVGDEPLDVETLVADATDAYDAFTEANGDFGKIVDVDAVEVVAATADGDTGEPDSAPTGGEGDAAAGGADATEGQGLYRADLADVRAWLEDRRENVDELQGWVEFTQQLAAVEGTICESFVDAFLEAGHPPGELVASFERAFFTAWLNELYDESVIGQFRADTFHKHLADFRSLDALQGELAAIAVQHRVTSRRPQLSLEHADSSEQVILRREVQKQRSRKPLRELFAEAGEFVTTLKPCFMMSPLSVAQFLRRDAVEFDIVIFDEASQVQPQDAISSLIRADQVVIAGDSKQLPPTRFFDVDVETAPDVREDLDSILEEAAAVLPEVNLRWHYRSRSDELIEFSNDRYYDGALQTFPENDPDTETGVDYVHVEDGVYDRGGTRRNAIEAERVVDLVEEHATRTPDRSLGVVAFSVPQEEAIREAIEARRRDSEALDSFVDEDDILGEFFVKNLEMVQGDERDRMIFSVGYGPDESGDVTMNFGPLNETGGERRLNVAITRARERVTVVSSLTPADIDLSGTSSTGVEHFKRYLEYARTDHDRTPVSTSDRGDDRGDSDHPDASDRGDSDHPHSGAGRVGDGGPLVSDVREALRTEGHVVDEIASSGYTFDFAVRDPGDPDRHALAVEVDGSAYARSKTARDRDRTRPTVLGDLGWQLHRVWSPDWATNRPQALDRLLERIDAESTGTGGDHADGERPDGDQSDGEPPSTDPVDADDTYPAELGAESGSERPVDSAGQRDGADDDGIDVGTYKPEEYARDELDELLPELDTYRPPDDAETHDGAFPDASPARIREALSTLVSQRGPIHRTLAARTLAKRWGHGRVTSPIRETLDAVVSSMEVDGYVVVHGEFLWPSREDLEFRVRQNDTDGRRIDFVPLVEIALAAHLVVENGLRMTREDLVVETTRLLGYDRVGSRIDERVNAAIDLLVETDLVRPGERLEACESSADPAERLLDRIYE